jgi:hypothetical protein
LALLLVSKPTKKYDSGGCCLREEGAIGTARHLEVAADDSGGCCLREQDAVGTARQDAARTARDGVAP